ncbi:type II toxin-antitoxin system RelE/ParE family toxin [Mucilaginibacter pedocola]|uniref:Addiction module toxin RelE n=1 Tax=Mucilaginibacter pedocola TaxID=1792845 RepID=A0A1S9PBE2_9SPHI|nr:type II toxin-antitoxin system RelE/ParE family toxin [Mucilaginibacter pedocola]OOQ58137.1 hypothetical protein BC343_10830 [Mucilaginibacter pedocola]
MYRLVVLKSAAEDIKESAKWYEEQKEGLGKRFKSQVLHKLNNVQRNPLLYAVKFSEQFRFAQVDVFPFLIVFEIVGDEVRVNSVFHTSRNPSRF